MSDRYHDISFDPASQEKGLEAKVLIRVIYPFTRRSIHFISRAEAACVWAITRRENTAKKEKSDSRKGRRNPRVPIEKLRTGGTAPFLKREEA